LPFVLLVFIILHIILLHEKGSSNPRGIKAMKVPFSEGQTKVDFFFFLILARLVIIILMNDEDAFGDDENFVQSNVIETPVHIQPE